MCIILTAYQKKMNLLTHQIIAGHIKASMNWNDDGAAIAYTGPEGLTVSKSLKLDMADLRKALQAPAMYCHLRQATSGKVNLDNIHLWTIGNWTFAHNGTVRLFSNGPDGKTDSLQFFERIIAEKFLKDDTIDWHHLEAYCLIAGLSGRFLLRNNRTGKDYYYGDWHLYLISEDAMIISSKTLTYRSTAKFFGIEFDTGEPNLTDELPEERLDGILTIDSAKGRSKFRKLKEPPKAPAPDWTHWHQATGYDKKANDELMTEFESRGASMF